jgi:hypothetical protein
VYIYANRDPALTTDFPTTPAWATDWSGLPDPAMVDRLNQLTLIAALVSGIAFPGVLALLAATRSVTKAKS